MTFDVEVVLKGRDYAVTETVSVDAGDPSTWNDDAVREVLIGVLRAIDRVQNPGSATDRLVALQGFSWIVEPEGALSVIAIEIPMGAVVAGPFAIGQAELDAMITRVLRAERQAVAPSTIH